MLAAAPPVAKQSLPQYGKSESVRESVLMVVEGSGVPTSGDNQDCPSVTVHHDHASKRQKLPESGRMLSSLCQGQDTRLIVLKLQEEVLVHLGIRRDQVPVRQHLRKWNGRKID